MVQLAFAEADYPAMLRLCEQAREAAETRGDDVNACVAMAYAALISAGSGDTALGAAEAEAALSRAQRLGHRDAIRSVINLAAVRFVSSTAPDFASFYGVLHRYERYLVP
jgi:hypothetical protein